MTSTTFEPKLWPISVEGKWGFIDATDFVRIEPQFANVEAFSQGLALVSVPGASEADLAFDRNYDGFIDEFGKFVIPDAFPNFYEKREDYDQYGYSSFEHAKTGAWHLFRSDNRLILSVCINFTNNCQLGLECSERVFGISFEFLSSRCGTSRAIQSA